MFGKNLRFTLIFCAFFVVFDFNRTVKAIIAEYSGSTINLDDILNEEFMPMSVFEDEKYKYLKNHNRKFEDLHGINNHLELTGSIDSAYDLMSYHK